MENTIIQQLFIELENTHPEHWSVILTNNKEKLLKLEKEQIVKAVNATMWEWKRHIREQKELETNDGEHYFNRLYKTVSK